MALNLPPVQRFLAQRAVHFLAEKLDTRVAIKDIRFHLLNRFELQGLYVADQNNDTLLFAGSAELRITDWFLFKPRPVVKFVGLRNARVFFHRMPENGEWNYQFIADRLKRDSKKPKEQKKENLQFDLETVELRHVRFESRDEWVGTDMTVAVEELRLEADEIDTKRKIVALDQLTARGFTYGITEYTGTRPDSLKPVRSTEIDTTAFNPGLWVFSLQSLHLAESRFFLDHRETQPIPGQFDETHLDITGIRVAAKTLAIRGDTITAHLENLAAKERCGLVIKKMTADIKVSPNISECSRLYLQTNNSVLRDYYAMQYTRFPDFLEYIDKVTMIGRLKSSEVGMQDIAYFAPELKRFSDISMQVSGNGKGTVARLHVDSLQVTDGISTLSGDLSLHGLPDIDRTFIDFRKGHLITSGAAALLYAPQLRRQEHVDLSALSDVDFKGNFTGFISDFVAYGTFNTNLGQLRADMNLKWNAAVPHYSGMLAASNFDLGKLLDQETLKTASFSANIKGSGFSAQQADLSVKGKIDHAFFNQYDYHDVIVAGSISRQVFEGSVQSEDPNASFDFNGRIDFSLQDPAYDFDATVRALNLATLRFSDDSLRFNGRIKLEGQGRNIDDFVGRMTLNDMNLWKDSSRLAVDSVNLYAGFDPMGQRHVKFHTNNFDARISGDFSILNLPRSVQIFLSYYLPQYVRAPEFIPQNQRFDFEVTAGNIDDLLSLVDPGLRLGQGGSFSGTVDLSRQELNLKGTIPQFIYDNITAHDIQLNAEGTYSGLKLAVSSNGVYMGQRDLISTLQFSADLFQDSVEFHVLTTSANSLGRAELQGLAYAQADSFFLNVLPSQFYLNQGQWTIPGGNRFVFAKKYFSIDNLVLSSGLQRILVNVPGKRLAGNQALFTLENIDISPINDLINMPEMTFDGIIDGTVTGKQMGDETIFEFDVHSDQVSVNSDTMGRVRVAGAYDIGHATLHLNRESGIHFRGSQANVFGSITMPKNKPAQIDGHLVFDDALAKWIEPFAAGFVRDFSGRINGAVKLGGAALQPNTSGFILLDSVGFTPDIIGVPYRINSGRIDIDNELFSVNQITVWDDLGNQATLSGTIRHDQLSRLQFRLALNSDHIHVLHLNKYENENFYGEVYSSVQMRVNGPWSDLSMTVFATPHAHSHLYIPITSGSDFGEYNYIRFKEYGTAQETPYVRRGNKFSFRLDAIITPDIEATIILDPATGDQIWAKGSGNIILNLPSDGEMKMNGNFLIDEGTYDFSFKQLQVLNYHKQFVINSNSAIKWNGDITDADLDVTAHTTVKARLYDLIQGEVERLNLSKEETRDAQIKQDVNVLMTMKGSLSEPDMKFKIALAEGRSIGTYAYQKLQRINSDEKQVLTQVASLLLLDQFVPPDGINNAAISSGTINNMSELISSAASSQITNFANKLLGMENLSVGVRYKNYSLSNASGLNTINYLNRNEAGINLRTNFLNDRLIVEVGGVYDWGRGAGQKSYTDNLAGDFRVQYLLTEDGRIRFSIFRTSDFDPVFLQRNVNRQGVGLSYRKSFDGLGDFFISQTKQRSARIEALRQSAPGSGTVDSAAIREKIKEQASTPEK